MLSLVACLATPAFAQDSLDASEFEAYVDGKTLYYSSGGVAYGVEEYLPDRRVRWSFLDGRCKEGEWYAAGDLICFEYEDGTGPQCWSFVRGSSGLRARFANATGASDDLYETQPTEDRMTCMGPDIGV